MAVRYSALAPVRQIYNRLVTSRCPVRQLFLTNHISADKTEIPADESKPVKFSDSRAASVGISNQFASKQRDIPWYQPISIICSVTIFMLYFFIFREENDLDQQLNYSLFDRLPGLEEKQLKIAIDYNQKQGKDTKALEERLAQLQEAKMS